MKVEDAIAALFADEIRKTLDATARRYGLEGEGEARALVEIDSLLRTLRDYLHIPTGTAMVLTRLRDFLDHLIIHATDADHSRWGN